MTFHDCIPYYLTKQNRIMKLRQAKKIMGWCKGDGDYYTIRRHKDHRESFWRKCERLRPMYYDEERGVWVHPSFHDIDIIRRAHTRLFRWIRKCNKLKERNNDRQFENQLSATHTLKG